MSDQNLTRVLRHKQDGRILIWDPVTATKTDRYQEDWVDLSALPRRRGGPTTPPLPPPPVVIPDASDPEQAPPETPVTAGDRWEEFEGICTKNLLAKRAFEVYGVALDPKPTLQEMRATLREMVLPSPQKSGGSTTTGSGYSKRTK